MSKPNSYNGNYGGLKVNHAGDWSRQDYHDHNKVHPDKLKDESKRLAMKPIPRNKTRLDSPKPTTKIVDLATNTKKLVDPAIEQAHLNDLKNKGLK